MAAKLSVNLDDKDVPRTIAQRIYAELHDSIILLDPPPGATLDVHAIATKLGVSRSPVRDALMRLAGDGLVDIMPQRGTCVSRIDLARAHEERFLRESLEVPSVSLLVANPDPGNFARYRDELATAIGRQRLAIERDDLAAFLSGDDEFHRAIFCGAGKSRCWEAVRSMSGHYRRLRFLALSKRAATKDLIVEHENLFRHIVSRDGAAALDLIRRHLARVDLDESSLRVDYPGFFTEGEPV